MYAGKPQVEAALAQFLQAQRWFGGKARGLNAVRIVDRGPLRRGVAAVLTFAEVELEDGKTDLYFIPIVMDVKDGAIIVQDALADESVRAAWLDVISDSGEFVTEAGRIRDFLDRRVQGVARRRGRSVAGRTRSADFEQFSYQVWRATVIEDLSPPGTRRQPGPGNRPLPYRTKFV